MPSAPEHISRDRYCGPWQVKRPRSFRTDERPAGDIATASAKEIVLWEFSGHTGDKQALFTRTRFLADDQGNLHGYDSNGRKVIVHPANRIIRFLP